MLSIQPRFTSASRKKGGFTLIELLVVIAIIAILAAILFPVFARAREKARQSTCVNNNKQLSLALLQYAQDFDETLPQWNFPGGTNYRIESKNVDPIWDAAVYPYVKTKGIFTCLSNSPTNAADIAPGWVIRSYALPRNISGMALGEVKNSADSVLLFEKGSQGLGSGADSVGEDFYQMWGADHVAMKKNPRFPHGSGKVFSFVDGHAKFFQVGTGPFAYAFPKPGGGTWPVAYCGGTHSPLYATDGVADDPGANLPL
jgi:prepilin-type N-terminal cleavage/methylation domain-containing protein/prepilin-type processing-associated H-X9-DG protein